MKKPRTGYLICTTPRAGSNWLCGMLTSTGVLGRPLEYFNGPARRQLDDPAYPLVPRAQIDQVLTRGMTPNDVYAVKLMAMQFLEVSKVVALADTLPDPKWIWLRRHDRLGQALSWARAEQTGQFRSTVPPVGPPVYDRDRILDLLRRLGLEEARWSTFFATYGITPLTLFYEDILAHPSRAVAAVAAVVGVTDALPEPEASVWNLAVQRDDLSEQWRVRFLQESGAANTMDRIGATTSLTARLARLMRRVTRRQL